MGKDEEFIPSPAMQFCYLDDIADFQFAQDFIQEAYDQCLEDFDDDPLNAFNKMAGKSFLDNDYVCFSITTSGIACGPVSSTVHYAFDMNYFKKAA